MFTPMLATPLLVSGRDKAFLVAAVTSSLAYFSVRYEFATTFALMWILPVVLIISGQRKRAIKAGTYVFSCVCISFLLIILLHHIRVAVVENVPISNATFFIFENLKLRVASLDNVPSPLSLEFAKNILYRLSEPSFAFEDIYSISNMFVIIVFLGLFIYDRRNRWLLVYIWAITAYLSWYVLGYQHIMQHYKYDALLFTCTISLSVVSRILVFSTQLESPFLKRPIRKLFSNTSDM